jgi:prophage DNA circulation protein
MTWRDDLRRVDIGGRKLIGASFRGVPFFVESSERAGGRRTVLHEFPLRDDPFVEDLGRRARTFRVDGYVIGDDYLSQRDALLTALEQEGPGELVHPYHGVRRAVCTTMSVRESRADGGTAAFAIEFAEAPTQAPVPTEVVDGVGQVAAGADAARAATRSELVEKFTASGLPSFAFGSAELAFKDALGAFTAKISPIVADTQELAALTGQIVLLTAETTSLVRTPGALIDAFGGTITALILTAAAAPGALMNALFDAYLADLGSPVVATTSTRQRELDNQIALTGALRRVIAIEAARLAPTVSFATNDEAIAARDTVASMLDEQAGFAGDTAYPAIVDLRSQVMRAVPGSTAFARVVTVTRNVSIPSLLLAYQLYGSVDLELDVVARNAVKHPGFIAGDLKVLSDGR